MNLDRLFTRSTAPIPTRPRVEANLEDQNRWRPLSPTQIDYTDTTGKVFHLDVTEITATIVNRITIVPNSTTPAFVVFLENAVTMAIHFLFSRRSLMAIHALFVEDWKGPVTPLACNAEELHEAYMFVMATLQALVNLPNGLKIGYSSLLMSLAKTDFNFDQRSSIVDGVSMRVMKQGTIIVHMVLPSLVNHATMGAQVLPVAVLSIAHEFIHVFIGHRYGHRLIPKTLEYQKFKAKSRTRPTGSSEPGFVYEQLVVGPSIFPVCVNVEDQNTVQGFGLDFFGHTNFVDVTVAPTNDWLNGFTDGCQADVYLATVPDDSIQLNQIPALAQYVEASRFRNIKSLPSSCYASRT